MEEKACHEIEPYDFDIELDFDLMGIEVEEDPVDPEFPQELLSLIYTNVMRTAHPRSLRKPRRRRPWTRMRKEQ